MLNFEGSIAVPLLLRMLAPDLLLLLSGLGVLGLDLLFYHRSAQTRARICGLVALCGVVLAAGANLWAWGLQGRVLHVLSMDAFVSLFRCMALCVVGGVILLSITYVRNNLRQPALFYALVLFCALAVSLLLSSVNLVMLLLAFDFLSICAYVLTGFLSEDKRSTEAAIKYLLYGAIVSAVMFYGLSWLYGLTGSADLATIAEALKELELWLGKQNVSFTVLVPVVVFVLAGLTYKVAAAPFHQWAPDAYEGAPVCVTALLSMAPKLAGIAVLLRVSLTLFPPDLYLGQLWRWPLMPVLAVLAMTLGNLAALAQDNIKRMMAYSGVAQVGYMLTTLSLTTPHSMAALVFYTLAYVIAELGAFAVIVAFHNHQGSDVIADYRGLWWRAPWLALVLLLSMLSLAGLPGSVGFVGKLSLFYALINSEMAWLAALMTLNTVISFAYYWKVIRAIFRQPVRPQPRVAYDGYVFAAALVSGLAIVALGIVPNGVIELTRAVVLGFFK